MRAAQNVAGGATTIRELFHFLWQRKLWWLIPFVTVLLLVGEATGVAPFIYTLF